MHQQRDIAMNRSAPAATGTRRLRAAAVSLLFACLVPGQAALPQSAVEIRVGAVVPPRLCLYPDPCAAMTAEGAPQALVDGSDVYFYGARPQVARSGELLLVLF